MTPEALIKWSRIPEGIGLVRRYQWAPNVEKEIGILSDGSSVFFLRSMMDDKYGDQLQIPMSALRWCLEAVAFKLLKEEPEGGLPDARMWMDTTTEGQHVYASRFGGIGGTPAGFKFTNASLPSFMPPGSQFTEILDVTLWGEQAVWTTLCDLVDDWAKRVGEPPLAPEVRSARPHVL